MIARRVLEAARAESWPRRAFWLVVAAVLILGPTAITLARSPSFDASVQLYPTRVGPFGPRDDPAYYRRLLEDPTLQQEMRRNAGARPAAYRAARIEPGRPALTLTVAASRPAEARRLVSALGPQLAGATQRALAEEIDRELAVRRRQAASRSPDEEARRRRARRLATLERIGRPPPQRIVLGPVTVQRPDRRWGDRLVASLPGELPARPSPVLAAFTGLLLAVVAWLIGLARVPPPPRGS